MREADKFVWEQTLYIKTEHHTFGYQYCRNHGPVDWEISQISGLGHKDLCVKYHPCPIVTYNQLIERLID